MIAVVFGLLGIVLQLKIIFSACMAILFMYGLIFFLWFNAR